MNSLRNRLSLVAALVLLAAAALLAFALQEFPRRLVEDDVVAQLQRDADLLYVRIHDAADPAEAARGAAGAVYELPLSGHYFRIRHGDTLIRSRSLWDEELPAIAHVGSSSERVQRLPGPAHQSLLLLAKRFSASDGDWLVVVAQDVSRLDAAIATFRRNLLAGAAIALALLLWLQRWLIVRGLAPLDDAIAACRRLEQGDMTPVATAAPAEVRPMLDAINRLVRHQAQRLARVRHTVGNLSHALKTPLTVLGQGVEETRSAGNTALAATLQAQLDAIGSTIERELRRARLAGGGAAAGGFDAREQLEGLASALERLYRQRDIAIEAVAPARRFALDREDMLELFGNLLDNACKWARTRVRIELRAVGADELAFTVEDDGPGVPEEALGQIAQAGMRIDERRPGHGLGLAIVADIVAQYRGSIRYERSDLLGGLRVCGRLSLGQAASS